MKWYHTSLKFFEFVIIKWLMKGVKQFFNLSIIIIYWASSLTYNLLSFLLVPNLVFSLFDPISSNWDFNITVIHTRITKIWYPLCIFLGETFPISSNWLDLMNLHRHFIRVDDLIVRPQAPSHMSPNQNFIITIVFNKFIWKRYPLHIF